MCSRLGAYYSLMKMHLEASTQNLISHYGPGLLSVNGHDYHNNILVSENEVFENWYTGSVSDLTLDAFACFLDSDDRAKTEILLLGSGSEHVFPPFSLIAEFKQIGISLEVMNTRAACRTYSVLVNEYRPVAAALFQIQSQ